MRRLLILALAMFALVVAGCAADDGSGETTTPSQQITVDQLVERSADTPITVSGLLISVGGVTKLCEFVLESYPPQCGGASVEVTGIDVASEEGAQSVGDVTWKDGAVVIVERQPDGRFAVVSG